MAVKLSSYYWFRNNSLIRSLEDVHSARYWFGKELSEKDTKRLKFIVEELDTLKEDSHFQNGGSLINHAAHVLIPHIVELKDVTSKPDIAAAYLEGIHGIMRPLHVKTEMYKQLGRCFDEIEVPAKTDTKAAIDFANRVIRGLGMPRGSLENMCWESVSSYMAKNRGAIPPRYAL